MQITGATTDPAARPARLHRGPPDARSSPPRQVRGWPGPGQGRRPDPEPQPTAHGTIVRLRDGSVVLIRQLQATDATLLAGIFTRLSPASRWMRFLAAKNHLTEAELRYLTNIDHHDHEALTALDHPGRQGVGVARYIRHPGDPRAAEIAITVIDDWHRRGLGTQLVTQLAGRARHAGITRFTALASADNAAIGGLLRSMRAEVVRNEADTVEYQITLAPPAEHDSGREHGPGPDELALDDHAGGQPAPGPHPAGSGEGLTSPWPQGRCPSCGAALDGGPVLFRCASCARAVHAADLDVEHRPAGPQTGTA